MVEKKEAFCYNISGINKFYMIVEIMIFMGICMKIIVRCLKRDFAVCPTCGSRNIAGLEKENCHCGKCGQACEVVFVNRVLENEEREPEEVFLQMSLFEEEGTY